jgi:hypothetical protein
MYYETFCDEAYHHAFCEHPWEVDKRLLLDGLTDLFSELDTILTSKEVIDVDDVEFLLDEISSMLKFTRSNDPIFIARPEVA